MLIEDFQDLVCKIELKRLSDISELQKSILRRQNRYKKILNLYLRLYEKWSHYCSRDVEQEALLTIQNKIGGKKVDDINNNNNNNNTNDDDVFDSCFDQIDDEHNADQTHSCTHQKPDQQERKETLSSDSSFDSGFFDDEADHETGFDDYHNLLIRIIEKHSVDSDDLENTMIEERKLEEQNKTMIQEERSRIECIQKELSTKYHSEGKLARTINASMIPSAVYVGFMQNVLSGMKSPDGEEDIDFEEYSKYCQVKWTLESVEMEYYSQCHKTFDQFSDLNRIHDQILDGQDRIHAMAYFYRSIKSPHKFKKGFLKNLYNNSGQFSFKNIHDGEGFKNLYNIYGYDNFAKYDDYFDSCYSHLDEEDNAENEQEQEHENETDHENETKNDTSQTHSIKNTTITKLKECEGKRDSFLKYLETANSIDLTPDSPDFEEALNNEINRLSINFMETLSEVKENILRNLDNSLKRKPAQQQNGVTPDSENAVVVKSELVRSSSVVTPSRKEDFGIHQRSTSDSATLPNKTPQTTKLSVQKSTSGENTPRRRIGTRRRKLPSMSKELFFLPPSEEGEHDDNINVNTPTEGHTSKSPIEGHISNSSGSGNQTQGGTPIFENNGNSINVASKTSSQSEHRKLCRVKGRLSPEQVKKTSEDLFGKKLINIQTIVVDGERLRIADFSDRLEKLSIKNRPRKLSIHNKNRGRNK